MVQKRPSEDELHDASSKQLRQIEPNNQLVSILEFPKDRMGQEAQTSGESEADSRLINPHKDEKLASCNVTEIQSLPSRYVGDDRVRGSVISRSFQATGSATGEDIRSVAPSNVSLSPDCCNFDRTVRPFIHSTDLYSYLLEVQPRKRVPIGPDYQADITEWNDKRRIPSDSETLASPVPRLDLAENFSNEHELTGICVIPMPKLEAVAYNDVKVGGGRNDCHCEDMGSVRCIQQHISEARANLRTTLGHDAFVNLGFCDMGEVVADRWSEEEELLFHEVVYSNPASLQKNFWNHLAVYFPSRTKKEIVSYYFNVFMLRKRAEQNRFDPLNIDSDNDEWPVGYDSADDETKMIDEDDDSGVESPLHPYGDNIHEASKCKYVEDVGGLTVGHSEDKEFNGNKVISSEPETCPLNLPDNSFDMRSQPSDRFFSNKMGDPNSQIGSSTSDDSMVHLEKVDDSKYWSGHIIGASSSGNHEPVLEPCSVKEWDVGYFSHRKSEVDLLPTCSMIEEVFGVGAWNSTTMDSHGVS